MVTLITTSPEALYKADGVFAARQAMQRDLLHMAEQIATVKDMRVLWVSCEDACGGPSQDTGMCTLTLERRELTAHHDKKSTAVELAMETLGEIEAWCLIRDARVPIVFVNDLDLCFYPSSPPGAFTFRLDGNRKLIEVISDEGSVIAADSRGHLVLSAALDQLPHYLSGFLDRYEWTWVRIEKAPSSMSWGASITSGRVLRDG